MNKKIETKKTEVVSMSKLFPQNCFVGIQLDDIKNYVIQFLNHYCYATNNNGIPKCKRYASAYIVDVWLVALQVNKRLGVKQSQLLCRKFSENKSNTWDNIKAHVNWLKNQHAIPIEIIGNEVVLHSAEKLTY